MVLNTDYLIVGAGASGLAFADALVHVITDAALHDKLVRAGRSRVSRFSWADCVRLTDAVIAEVLPEL